MLDWWVSQVLQYFLIENTACLAWTSCGPAPHSLLGYICSGPVSYWAQLVGHDDHPDQWIVSMLLVWVWPRPPNSLPAVPRKGSGDGKGNEPFLLGSVHTVTLVWWSEFSCSDMICAVPVGFTAREQSLAHLIYQRKWGQAPLETMGWEGKKRAHLEILFCLLLAEKLCCSAAFC